MKGRLNQTWLLALTAALALSFWSVGCADSEPSARDALAQAATWISDAPTIAEGEEHVWTFAQGGSPARHRQGDSPGAAAFGPVIADGDTYFIALAEDEPWYQLRPGDVNELWTADEFNQETKEGVATLLAAVRLVNPLRLIELVEPEGIAVEESAEFEDAWRLTGDISARSVAAEGLDQVIMDAVAENPLYPGDIKMALDVDKETGAPLGAEFRPIYGEDFSYRFFRVEESGDSVELPEVPEDARDIRELLGGGSG